MAKKVLSILCAIAMMVTMLSVGMISVFAAGNLGTLERVEVPFGSLKESDSVFSFAGISEGQVKNYWARTNTTVAGDAMYGRYGAATLTNTAKLTTDGDFEFSYRSYYYDVGRSPNAIYAQTVVKIGDMTVVAIPDGEMYSETEYYANPTVTLTYGDTTLTAKPNGYEFLSTEEKAILVQAAVDGGSAQFVNNAGSFLPPRYVTIKVTYVDGVLSLNVNNGQATDSATVAVSFEEAVISFTTDNNLRDSTGAMKYFAVGLGNWSGSYFSEEYIEGDAGEDENTGYVSNIASGTDLLTPSTLAGTITESDDIGAYTNGVSNTVYAATDKKTKLTFDTYAFWSRATGDLSVVSSQEYNFGENFEVTATMIIINQQQGNPSKGYVALGDVKLSLDRPTGGATETDVIIKLTNGTKELGTYTTTSAHILDSDQFTASQLRENEETIPNGTYTFKYENGLLSVLYRNQVLEFDGGLKTFEVDASAFNGVKFSVGVKSTARTSFIGNCVYTDNTVVEVDPYASNIESGTDLLEGCTGDVVAAGTSFDTGASNQATLTLDTTAHVFSTFGGVSTVTTANKNFGTNFEVSAKMLVANQSQAVTMGSVSIGDIKLTYDRPAGTGTNLVTITLSNGNTVLGTYTSPAEVKAWSDQGLQFKNNKVDLQEPNGTYTFKYVDGKLSVKFKNNTLTNNTLTFKDENNADVTSFAIDAAAFKDVAFSTSLDSNGRAVFVYDCIYTNLTPVLDKDLDFAGAQLVLGNGVGINFLVKTDVYNAYENVEAVVKYTYFGEAATKTYTLKDLGGYMGFEFKEYLPTQMDEVVNVTLTATKNGANVYSEEVEYSIAKYIKAKQESDKSSAELKAAVTALEEYCKATAAYVAEEAYEYIGEKIELTRESDYHFARETVENATFDFAGCTINLRETPTVLFAFRTNEKIDGYKFKATINGRTAEIASENFVKADETAAGTLYYVYYREVTVLEMESEITGQIVDSNNVAASDAITYSVVSYAYYQQEKANDSAVLYNLTQALVAYGRAVATYAK